MAKFDLISEGAAPKQPRTIPKALRERQRQYEEYVEELPSSGKVGVLEPDEGEKESARGLSLRISRAAKRLGVEVETYIVDNTVYFKRVTGETKSRRKRTKGEKKHRTVERVHQEEKEPASSKEKELVGSSA